jgi:pyruvate/2-oxoglutarate dehydrogenase complex dihydrolipoamide dehydrogenase (E3) component
MANVDAIIIGAGQAGPSLAGRLSDAGMTVVLVERHLFGGTCVNTGCMPTKTLVASAYAAHLARRGPDFGVVSGPVSVDMKKVHERAATVAANARASVEKRLRGLENCTVVQGHARFESPDTVRVGKDLFTAPKIFINVGGRALVPDMPGVADVPFLTNTSMVAIDRLPRHLVVIGGSYIGLEFAQMMKRFGADVTVVEKSARLLPREDEDVSTAIREIVKSEGIAVRTGAECIRLAPHPDGVQVGMNCTQGPPAIAGSDVLLAVGRRPNTDDLGLDKAGVDTDPRGYIVVDDRLATSVPGIWAMGDCNGRGAFTHTAYNDYEIIAANLLDGANRTLAQRISTYALYIDPPLGRVGMSETEARKSGRKILVGRRPMTRVGRAIEKDETKGFMKVIADADSKQILGATILGTGGDEAIHGVIDLMNAGATYDVLQWAVPIHPTISELWPTVVGAMEYME